MEGKVMSIHLKISTFIPNTSNTQPIFDNEWIIAERERLGIPPDEKIQFKISATDDQLFVFDEAGHEVGNFRTVLRSVFPSEYVELAETNKEHFFGEPIYMLTGVSRFPRMKLRGIRSTISVTREDMESIFDGNDFIGFIMRDVIGDKVRLFDKQSQPIKGPDKDTTS
jgi:hypothetical protein